MRIEKILEEFSCPRRRPFPRIAVEAAVEQQEAITPHLLRALEDAPHLLRQPEANEGGLLVFFALFLLAQFREERAYPLLVDLAAIPGESIMDYFGDFITEDLGRLLASISGGNIAPMRRLVEDPQVNEYVRSGALVGMLTLVAEGIVPRDEIVAYFRSLYRGGLEKQESFVWSALVSESSKLYPEELMPEIEKAFADDLVDTSFIDLPWIERILNRGQAATLKALQENQHYRLINDTVEALESWLFFHEEPPPPPAPSLSPASSGEKVGRNAPCPCGSGRKYKHCCGRPGVRS